MFPCLTILGLLILVLFLPGPADALARARHFPKVRMTASSSLTLGGEPLGPEKALDADLSTGWAEGQPGQGRGEWLEIDFGRFQSLSSVTIFGGDFTSEKAFQQQNHLQSAELRLLTREGEKTFPLEFPDRAEPLTVALGFEARKVKLELGGAYAGALGSDTRVAEIAFNLADKDASMLEALEAWKESVKGRASLTKAREGLNEALAQVEAGKSDGFAPLQEAIRRGLEPLREWLELRLPPGFALTYLEPDMQTLEAVKGLCRREPVPAIEQAVWIAKASDATYLRRIASYLGACSRLKGAAQRNPPIWGANGFQPGALQSRGEPLPLAVDSEGAVYVADVGNNRVQRYSDRGRFERAAGASNAGVEEYFLGRQVPYYVAGSVSSLKAGEFTQPLAICLVLHRGQTMVAVIDANRHLQLLDAELRPIRMWSVPSDAPILSGVGLAGPVLLYLRGRLYCLWGEKAFVYDLDGQLQSSFELEARVRSGVALGGKLLLNFKGTEIVRYGKDGFRYGSFIKLPESDTSEDIDLAVGEDGKLYVHSDAGFIYRYSKRGKLLSSAATFKEALYPYRLAVGVDMLYLTARDKIRRFPLP